MRTLLLFFLSLLVSTTKGQLTMDNFDSYPIGSFDPQWVPGEWVGWFGNPSNVDISNVQAYSSPNSMEVSASDDIVALLGVLDQDVYEISFQQYVPASMGTHYNFQHNYTNSSGDWACEIYFTTSNTAYIRTDGVDHSFTPIHDQWVENKMVFDFDNDEAKFYYDGTLTHTWVISTNASGGSGLNQINAIDFYGNCTSCSSPAYYDDVNVIQCVAPAVSFTASTVTIGDATTFTDASSNVDPSATYSWDFDNDGTEDASTVGNVSYTYTEPGTYTPELKITNTSTCVDSTTITAVVNYATDSWEPLGPDDFGGGPGFSLSNVNYTAIAIDGNNIPFVTYLNGTAIGNTSMYAAKFENGSWQTLQGVAFSAGHADFSSIAIDGNNVPYIAYRDYANSAKATVHKYDGSWAVVGSAGFSASTANYTEIAIDGNDTPFIVYQDASTSFKATVKEFDGSSWVNVGSGSASGSTAQYTDIAINGNDVPFIVFKDGGVGNKATVNKFDGSNWVTVGSAGFSTGAVEYTTIAIDENNVPYVAYQDIGNGSGVTVKKWDGSNWVTVGNTSFSAGTATHPSIVIHSNNVPFVVYRDGADGNKATVQQFDVNNWITVGSAGFSADGVTFPSLAIDDDGTLIVTYGSPDAFAKYYSPSDVCELPTANFSADVVTFGSATTFTDASTNIDPSATYSWDFDNDGTEDDTTVGNTTFTFPSPGTYITKLTIINPVGCVSTSIISVTVNCDYPTVSFTSSSSAFGTPTEFTDASTADIGATYSWDFDDDGNEDDTTMGNTSHSYPAPGSYTARLTITNLSGCASNSTISVNVNCDDGIICTDDSFVSGIGCVNTPSTSLNGQSCGSGGTCNDGACEFPIDPEGIYWTDSGRRQIKKSDDTGTSKDIVHAGLESPIDIALNFINGKMIWSEEVTGVIQRANRNGSDIEEIISSPSPQGIVIDDVNSKIYWADKADDNIQRADLDGSNIETVIGSGINNPYDVALDITNGKIYWSERGGSGVAKIQRANSSDGSNVEELLNNVDDGIDYVYSLVLDVANNIMYWVDGGTDKIQCANLDGSNVTDLVTSGLIQPYGLALDTYGDKLYWTDAGTNEIKRIDLNTLVIDLLINSGLVSTRGIVLDIGNNHMYWVDASTDKVQRADFTGANVTDLHIANVKVPNGLALDLTNNKLYWTDNNKSSIQRSDLDGDNVELLISGGFNIPREIELDLANGDMYWTDEGAAKIQSSNLDGTGIMDILDGGDGLINPTGLALDVPNGKLYWADRNTRTINKANLDGTSIQELLNNPNDGLILPEGIALDLSNNKMYWADRGAAKIQRSDINGNNLETIVDGSDGLIFPWRVVLDLVNNKIYWTDFGTSKIQRSDLDGSNIEDVVASGLGNIGDIALNIQALLPISLMNFTANAQNQTTLLHWQTASEQNNKGFHVERSTYGREWNTLGFVAGNGTTFDVSNYTYADEAPKNGINYYRLKQEDHNGRIEYSVVRTVYFGKDEESVVVYPNPFQDYIVIKNGQGKATIFNIIGEPIKQLIISSAKSTINTADLVSGSYLVIEQENGKRSSFKIVN